MKRLVTSLMLTLSIAAPSIAQSATNTTATAGAANTVATAEQQQKLQQELDTKSLALLDEIIVESQTLRIAENRLHIKLMAANLLWPRNEARARALFKEAMASLVEMNNEIDRTDPESGRKIREITQLRQEMLQILARRDARLAREFLRATRQPASASTENAQTNARYRQPDEERQMELSLASELAADDPKEALKIARENLSRGISYQLIEILNKLHEKDQEAAAKLAGDIITKLRTENLETNQEAATVAVTLLRMALKPMVASPAMPIIVVNSNMASVATVSSTNSNSSTTTTTTTNNSASNSNAASSSTATTKSTTPILDETAIKDLTEMVAAAAINSAAGNPMLLMSLRDMMPEVEKYAPSRGPALRRKLAALNARRDGEVQEGGEWMKYRTLMESGTTESILEAASKASPEMREMLYQIAVSKATNQGEIDRARQLINERVADPAQRARMLAELDRQALTVAAGQGKLEQVRQMLSRLRSNEERAGALVVLATAIGQRGDKKTALQLLDEARGMISVRAKNSRQLLTQLAVAHAYAPLDAARSLAILEPIVDQLNELIAAGAVLGGFFAEEFVQDDEIAMAGLSMMFGSVGSTEYAADLTTLARANFERTKALADRFQRSEVRLIARLLIAQSMLSDQQADVSRNRGIGIVAPISIEDQ